MKTKVKELRYDWLKDFESLTTEQLLFRLGHVRAVKSMYLNYAGPRCCELCKEYIGEDWEKEVKPYLDECNRFLKPIKEILKTRPDVETNKKLIRQLKAKAKKNR